MSVSVYILQSDSTGGFYIGQGKDPPKRLKKHNNGESRSTKGGRPWRLVYSEELPNRCDAVRRERYLKSPKGWKELKEIKERIASERSAAR
jgi:putative endonuclease